MLDVRAERVLALWGIVPVGAVAYFLVFWTWFDFWRKRRVLAYVLMALIVGGGVVLVIALRRSLLVGRLVMPPVVRSLGWALIAVSIVFGFVADRQIGLRVRSFMPFFDAHGRIKLRTSGAYSVVRHPIYAAGCVFQLGTFLVTGYPAVLVAWAIFVLGAVWFSRQEEERLMALLDDPQDYVSYRERVPALFPRISRRSSA